MADISDLTQLADSKPEEAAQNIERSSILNIEPAAYKQYKDELNTEYEKRTKPTQASPTVAEYMRQSPEHTALAVDDTDHLSYVERQAHLISDYLFDRPTNDRKVIDLSLKKMNDPDNFTADDDLELYGLNKERQTLANRNYGLDGPIEQLPAQVAGALGEMARSAVRQAPIIGGATVAGAGIGAAAGTAVAGPAGTIPGAIAGASQGFTAGFVAGNIKDTYDSMSGSTYNELSHAVDPNGQPLNIDETTKKDISRGVGVVSGVIAGGLGYALAKTTPFLSKYLGPAAAKQIVLDPTNAAIKATIMNIGKAAGSGTLAGGLTEVTRILGEEMGQSYDGTEASFLNALSSASKKIDQLAPRVATASAIGGLTAGAVAAATGAVGFKSTRESFRTAQDQAVAGARDVTPQAPKMLQDPNAVSSGSGERPIDVGPTPVQQSTKVLQLRTAMENISKVSKSTKMAELAPGQLSSITQMIFTKAGLNKVWISADDVSTFFNDPDKAAVARRIIGVPSEVVNAPISIPPHKFMELVQEFPKAYDMMRVEPDGPKPTQAEEFLSGLDKAETQRREVFQKLGISNAEPVAEEPSNVVDIKSGLFTPEETKRLELDQQTRAQNILDRSHRINDLRASISQKQGELGIANADPEKEKQLQRSVNSDRAKLDQLMKKHESESALFDKIKADLDKSRKREKPAPVRPEDTEALVRRAETLMTVMEHEAATPEEKANATAELEQIKTQVKAQYGVKDPGQLIIADWGQPIEKVAQKAEQNFMADPQHSEALKSIVPEGQLEKFTAAVSEGRGSILAEIKEAAEHELTKVQDVELEHAREVQKQIEQERIANDPAFALVDQFRRDVVANTKGNKKTSIYAIDPKLLSEAQQVKYANNALLKEHGVFAKGGLSPNEAAEMMGFTPGGDALLDTLSRTPTRKQVVAARAAAYDADLALKVKDSVPLDHLSIFKALDNDIRNASLLMKYMREKEWATTKGMIKRIALPQMNSKVMEAQVIAAVNKMKLGDLNPTPYKIGARQSFRQAMDAVLKMEPEKAFLESEAHVRNLMMQKQVMMKIGKTNRILKFSRRLNEPSVKQEFRDAGKSYDKAKNEILDVFNLNPSMKGQSERGAFIKYVKDAIERGESDISIPERLSDVRQSVNELTTEQIEVIGDRLATLYHQAKFKNRLVAERLKKNEIETTETAAAEIHEAAVKNPNYDPKRIEPAQGSRTTPYAALTGGLASGEALLSNMEHIVTTWDGEQLNGAIHTLIAKKLKGDGEWNGKMGESGLRKDLLEFTNHFKSMIEQYDSEGTSRFRDLNNTWLEIEEFKDLPKYNNGRLVKGDLLMLAANKGDPDGRVNIIKMGADIEVVRRVLEKHLETKDIKFVQNMVNLVGSYGDRSVKLQKQFTGQDTTLVKGMSWEFNGQTVEGGYWPQAHVVDYTDSNILQTLKSAATRAAAFHGGTEPEMFARQYAAEMTEQGRFNQRVGSDRPLDLSMTRFVRVPEEILHDLNYRIPVRDVLNILRHPEVKTDLIAIGGKQKYGVVVSTAIELANQVTADNRNFFGDQSRVIRLIYGHLNSGFSVGVLALNAVSTLIQPVSLTQTALRAGGVQFTKHAVNVAMKIMTNPHLIKGMYDLAVEINPSIASFMNDLEDSSSATVHDLLPSKNKYPKLAPLARAKEAAVSWSMWSMGAMDQVVKMLGSNALYHQFMSGDAEGFPLAKVMEMEPAERHKQAIDWARQTSRLTLTHGMTSDKAPFQKLPGSEFMARFWNDPRNVFNNTNAQGRKIKWKLKDLNEKLGEGHSIGEGSRSSANGAAAEIVSLMMVMAISKVYVDKLRGYQKTPLDKDFDLTTAKGLQDGAKYMTGYMMNSVFEGQAESIPGLRDILYASNLKNERSDQRNVQIPLTKMQSDVATTFSALSEMLRGDRYKLSKVQLKSALMSGSYIVGGFPVNGPLKLKEWMEKNGPMSASSNRQFKLNVGAVGELKEEINAYKLDPPEGASEAFMKQLDELDLHLGPKEAAGIPTDMKEILKTAKWNTQDPKTGAAGVYQFTQKQWTDIMHQAPDLGLTENGRVAQDSKQQERAIEFVNKRNAEALKEKDLPVDAETLYGAHVLGLAKTIKIYQEAGDTKVKTIGDLPEQFSKYKTVGQVRKAIKTLVNDKRLTLTAENAED